MFTETGEEECSILFRSPDSFTLFQDLRNNRIGQRNECLRAAGQLLLSWYHGFGSPKEESMLANPQDHFEFTHLGDDSMYYLINQQLPDLLRFLHTCPWRDVRMWCAAMLEKMKSLNMKIPQIVHNSPSYFIDASKIPHLYTYLDDHSSTVSSLLIEQFCKWCRVDNISLLMAYHPEYLECYIRLYNHLMGDECPLPYAERHYICIMAAARHRCDYLIRLHTVRFILEKGNPDWLKGIQYAPEKFQKLKDLNKYLAHRPWDIRREHVDIMSSVGCSYSLSQLLHAVVLMSHTHALCSFIYGCGVAPEIDSPMGHSYATAYNHGDHRLHRQMSIHTQGGEEPIEELMDLMKSLGHEECAELTREEVVERFKTVQHQNLQIMDAVNGEQMSNPLVQRFLNDPDFNYITPEENDSAIFHIQDFSWEDIGISLSDQLINGLGQLMDDKFTNIYDLTYCTMGDHNDVDTGTFRRAVWNYVHSLYSVLHDDYNYSCVERLLPLPLKSYLKKTATMPSTVTKRDYDNCMTNFKHSEKVHVNLMVMEARLQASLLYALRAIKRSRL